MSTSADEKLQQHYRLFDTPPNYKPIEDEEFDFDVPDEFMNISLGAPCTCSSESDSFDLDTLLGVSKQPLPSAASTATPSVVGGKVLVDTVASSTCNNTESKLTPPLDNQDPRPTMAIHESENDREETCSDSSRDSSSNDRIRTRSRHNTFTLSTENEGNSVTSIDNRCTGQPTPINTTTQVKRPASVDQPSISNDSTHPLVTPSDLPSCVVSSRTYSKGSSLHLPVTTSSGEDTVATSVTRLKLPSSLKKPAKSRGTFNSSPLQSLHLDEIKSDLFNQAEPGGPLASDTSSVSPASSGSASAIGPSSCDQPSLEEKASNTSSGSVLRTQVKDKKTQEMKRPLTTRNGGTIVRRPSQLRKPLSAPLSRKRASKPDSTKHNSQQQLLQPLSKPVPGNQEAGVKPKNIRSNTITLGQTRRAVVGVDKSVLQGKPRRPTSTVTEASTGQCRDFPAEKSTVTRQNKTTSRAKELDRSTLKDKPPTEASSLPQEAKGKDMENESSGGVLVKKRRSLIPTPTNLEGKPANSTALSDQVKQKLPAFPARFKKGSAPPKIKKASGIRIGPLRPLVPNSGPIKAKPLSSLAQDSIRDDPVADFQLMSITSDRPPVVHSPVNKENQPQSPHSEWSPIRRKKPLPNVEECYQCTKYTHH